jgi:hypothetical protein
MPSAPQRIQRSRAPGWRMPPGAAYVGRPSRWGNPFQGDDAAELYRRWMDGQMTESEWIERAGKNGPEHWDAQRLRAEAVELLRGVTLACWCRPDQPCHADVLLEIANA